MRPLTGILLFACLLAPVIGTWTAFHIRKAAIRKEVKARMIAGMDRRELVLLTFSKAASETELRWKHDREFEYNGHMYDIVSSEMRGDSVAYLCWPDGKETGLNRQLSRYVAGAWEQNADRQALQKRLVDYYQLLYYQDPFTWQPRPIAIAPSFITGYSFHCPFFFRVPPAPPPEMVSASMV